jgi:hypothetical protein
LVILIFKPLVNHVLITLSSPRRMPYKRACALNARRGGPKGERSESSRASLARASLVSDRLLFYDRIKQADNVNSYHIKSSGTW